MPKSKNKKRPRSVAATLPLAKALARSAAANAARISAELKSPQFGSIGLCDLIAQAGLALALAESQPGFDWEKTQTDWESTCAQLAPFVESVLARSNYGGDWSRIVRHVLEYPRPSPEAVARYSFGEAVADLSANFERQELKPDDSRETVRLVIEWAEEFERKHAGHQWGQDGGPEYMDAIDVFFFDKYTKWQDVPSGI